MAIVVTIVITMKEDEARTIYKIDSAISLVLPHCTIRQT